MNSLTRRLGGCCLLAALLISPVIVADTVPVAEDVHIDLDNPEDSNGTVPNLVVSNIVDRRTGERLTYLSFDLPVLPEGANLEQAWLRIFVGRVSAPGDVDLYRVTEPWEEHGISASTVPGFEALPFMTFSVANTDEGHFLVVDVTPEVLDWLSGAEPNHGFVLVPNPAVEIDVSFDSKENSQTGHHSELELVLGVAEGGVDSDDIADNSIGTDDIADNSVGTDDIADNSIGSDDIADNSITSDDILDGTVGGADVDKDEVQLRVNGTCAAGSSIREIDNMGGVVCETDDDSGGDITSVFPSSGGGLQGGAASGDAELRIAPGGVTSAMVADGTIGSADVNQSQVQRRVWQWCPPHEAINSIAPDGQVTCVEDAVLDPDLFWKIGGNGGTSPIPGGTDYLGTTDDTDLALGVNGMQGMRLSFATASYPDGTYEGVNVIGGHSSNRVTAWGGTVAGGGYVNLDTGVSHPNKVEAYLGTIAGGAENAVFTTFGTIAGGRGNIVRPNSHAAFIGGGQENVVQDGFQSTLTGGESNSIYRFHSFIGGGFFNTICDPEIFPVEDYDDNDGRYSVIAGGSNNRSCGPSSFIGGGFANFATGQSSMIIGGAWNRARGNYSIAAGHFSEANEDYSIALGAFAHSLHHGAVVISDGSSIADFESQRDNQFRFRATGGARFDVNEEEWVEIRSNKNWPDDESYNWRLIDTSVGAYLALGGGWVNGSDRERKADFRDVDPHWVLQQVAAIPIQTWRYKVEPESVRHIGPMAQDFQAFFGFGGDPRGIMTLDADGVALAAIQALYRMTAELQRRTRQLEAQQNRLDALEAGLQALKARLGPIEGPRFARADMSAGSE